MLMFLRSVLLLVVSLSMLLPPTTIQAGGPPIPALPPSEVLEWCALPGCEPHHFAQTKEQNGFVNPVAVTYLGKDIGAGPMSFNVPSGVHVQVWDCIGGFEVDGPKRLDSVCRATFRATGLRVVTTPPQPQPPQPVGPCRRRPATDQEYHNLAQVARALGGGTLHSELRFLNAHREGWGVKFKSSVLRCLRVPLGHVLQTEKGDIQAGQTVLTSVATLRRGIGTCPIRPAPNQKFETSHQVATAVCGFPKEWSKITTEDPPVWRFKALPGRRVRLVVPNGYILDHAGGKTKEGEEVIVNAATLRQEPKK